MPDIYRRIANLFPTSITNWLDQKLVFAGVEKDPRDCLGEWLLLSLLSGLILLLLYYILFWPQVQSNTNVFYSIILVAIFLGGFAAFFLLYYLNLYYTIRKRTIEMEKILPDFLLLVVSNLRAGMTPWDAFVMASRPEFGALYKEVWNASSILCGDASLADALYQLSLHFDSDILKRVVKLFVKGTRSGGKIAMLLTASAREIRSIQDMRQELITTTRNYTIFLTFIVIFLMPFLLAVSTHFIHTFTEIHAQTMAVSESFAVGGVSIVSGAIAITEQEMFNISIITLFLTSLLISFLSGIISRGRALDGLKYFPLLAGASTIMYLLSKLILTNTMSQFV